MVTSLRIVTTVARFSVGMVGERNGISCAMSSGMYQQFGLSYWHDSLQKSNSRPQIEGSVAVSPKISVRPRHDLFEPFEIQLASNGQVDRLVNVILICICACPSCPTVDIDVLSE
jgi:hypothetical protein